MPWNITRTAAFYEKEFLKYPTGFESVKNTVIDATQVVANSDGRYVVEGGTLMKKSSADSSKVEPMVDNDSTIQADVRGVLAHTIEFWGNADDSYDEPGALFWFGCIFDVSKLVGYTGNSTNVKAALNRCEFL